MTTQCRAWLKGAVEEGGHEREGGRLLSSGSLHVTGGMFRLTGCSGNGRGLGSGSHQPLADYTLRQAHTLDPLPPRLPVFP